MHQAEGALHCNLRIVTIQFCNTRNKAWHSAWKSVGHGDARSTEGCKRECKSKNYRDENRGGENGVVGVSGNTAHDAWKRSKPIRDQVSDAAAVVCPPRASTKQSD